MWVLINKTYAGPLGMFFAGQKCDIPESTVEQLRKELGKASVIDVCAPWDEHKDHKMVAAAEAKQKALAAIAHVETIQKKMVALREIAKEINVSKKELDDAVPKAKFLAKEAGIPWPPAAGAK